MPTLPPLNKNKLTRKGKKLVHKHNIFEAMSVSNPSQKKFLRNLIKSQSELTKKVADNIILFNNNRFKSAPAKSGKKNRKQSQNTHKIRRFNTTSDKSTSAKLVLRI